MTAEERRQVRVVKRLLTRHDRMETRLVNLTRTLMDGVDGVPAPPGTIEDLKLAWHEHDLLEREIIMAAAVLEPPIVRKLQRGEL